MLAASYWSLLAPAIEMAEESGSYGENGEWAFVRNIFSFYPNSLSQHARTHVRTTAVIGCIAAEEDPLYSTAYPPLPSIDDFQT